MDKVEIQPEQVIPLEHVAARVHGLRILFVNVFAIGHADNSWTLIDTGLPLTEAYIRNWADRHFGTAPNAIILSHGHFDHVSSARDLADYWNIPIYAHLLEHPYLTGRDEYPAPNATAGGGMMSLLSPLLPRGPVDLRRHLQSLPPGTGSDLSIPEMPGWQILHTPGHTPGHVSFFRPADRALLPCDAFCTTKPESFFQAAIAQTGELHGPPAYFTTDWTQAKQSVRFLAGLEPLIVAPGHGQPIAGSSVPIELRQLADRFDQVAVPENRHHPAA